MPYNRYDAKNRFDRRGRKTDEKMGLKIFLLVAIPFLIVGIVILGIVLSLNSCGKSGAEGESPIVSVATEDEITPVVSDSELLRVVNDRYPLEADYVPELKPFGGVAVAAYVFEDLDHMIAAAADAGVDIKVTVGYVSYSDQVKLYETEFDRLKNEEKYSDVKAEAEAKKVAPQSGCSESQTGLLLELSSDEKDFAGSEAEAWLDRNAVNYGFVLRYPEDKEDTTGMSYNPKLYRYVGSEHALNMRRYGMTLNEYATHVAQH